MLKIIEEINNMTDDDVEKLFKEKNKINSMAIEIEKVFRIISLENHIKSMKRGLCPDISDEIIEKAIYEYVYRPRYEEIEKTENDIMKRIREIIEC